jgi:hypothetical protein
MPKRSQTIKQVGDAGEMLVAAEITLAGVPALWLPDFWPGYDVVAQPANILPQRISVKTRTFAKSGAFVGYDDSDVFDWLAIVVLPGPGFASRRIFIVPRKIADERSYSVNRTWRPPGRQVGPGFFIGKLIAAPTLGGQGLADYENNFSLAYDVAISK